MDVSKAFEKFSNIQDKINNFNTKIKDTYNKYAKKINELIDKIEDISNRIAHATKQGIIWLEIEINKLLKQLSDLIKVATDKINAMTKQAGVWYEDTIKNIKLAVVKSSVAKTGIDMPETVIESTAAAIPHPSFNSIVPEIKIDLKVPMSKGHNNEKYDENNPQHNLIDLKKLPLL